MRWRIQTQAVGREETAQRETARKRRRKKHPPSQIETTTKIPNHTNKSNYKNTDEKEPKYKYLS